jgi:hypothetical protein
LNSSSAIAAVAPRSGSARLRPLRGLAWGVLCLWALALVWWAVQPRMNASQIVNGGTSGPVRLPWVFHEVSRGNLLHVDLQVNWLTPRRWNIVPDDRLVALHVNGQEVPLNTLPQAGLSDWQLGFDIDLSPWLHSGTNQLDLVVDNYGWDGGISLRPRLGWRWLPLGAVLLGWALLLARAFRLQAAQTAVLGLALVPLCVYLSATPWNHHVHDVTGGGGHLAYIAYVAEHWALPPPGSGWTFYHPPLYYLAGAAVWRWSQWLGLPGAESLQLLALLFWLVFLAAAAGTLRLALPRASGGLLLATAALALWPGGYMHGVAIGNDAPLYAAAGVATWFMLRWWRRGRRGDLLGMAVSIALALLVKSNAVVLVAAALALLGLRLLHRRTLRLWLEAALAAAIMAAGAALTFGVRYYQYLHHEVSNWLIANAPQLSQNLRVPVTLRAFLPLDVPVFLTVPWLDSSSDATGRANFWNYLLRSSLSGEFQFDGTVLRWVSFLWGALLLWLLWLLLLPRHSLRWSRRSLWREAPWLLLGLLWLASLIVLRIKTPFACSNDFRYILPVLLPFLVACSRAGALARTLLAGVCMGSLVFLAWL